LVKIYLILFNMSLEVDIYMNDIIKFFKDNPNELKLLVPASEEDLFYTEIRKIATENVNNGEDPTLTRKQMIDICVRINRNYTAQKSNQIFQNTIYGEICLN
jgi:hypothetical protein